MKKMLFLLPIFILLELLALNGMLWLLREANDVAFICGVFALSAFSYINYSLIKYLIVKTKNK